MSEGYCSSCEHPVGYHDAARGCTMPLGPTGLPLGRNERQSTTCRCNRLACNSVEKPKVEHGLAGFLYHGSDRSETEHFTWYCQCGWDTGRERAAAGEAMLNAHLAQWMAEEKAQAFVAGWNAAAYNFFAGPTDRERLADINPYEKAQEASDG